MIKESVFKGMYTKEVIKHFLHPHNMGEMKNPDGVGEAGNPSCGDFMKMSIKVKDDKIKEVRFKTLGCAVAIAVSSIVTDLAKGEKVEEANKLTNKNIIKKLGDVPAPKVHCSFLAVDALKEALYDYLSKKKMPISSELASDHKRIQAMSKSIREKYKIKR